MSDATQLQVVFGMVSTALLPILVSWLKRCEWDSRWKSALSLFVALVLGACSAALAGKWNSKDVLTTVTTVYTLSSAAYTLWFKNLDFNKWLERQEPV